jgi:hypothetical protein
MRMDFYTPVWGRGRDSVKFAYRHIYIYGKSAQEVRVASRQRNELVLYELAQMAYFSAANCRVISALRGPSVYQSRTIHASTHAGDVVGGPVKDKCLRRGLARWRADSSVMETGG